MSSCSTCIANCSPCVPNIYRFTGHSNIPILYENPSYIFFLLAISRKYSRCTDAFDSRSPFQFSADDVCRPEILVTSKPAKSKISLDPSSSSTRDFRSRFFSPRSDPLLVAATLSPAVTRATCTGVLSANSVWLSSRRDTTARLTPTLSHSHFRPSPYFTFPVKVSLTPSRPLRPFCRGGIPLEVHESLDEYHWAPRNFSR